MYLRETHRRNADGSVVSYLALAHNERDPRTGTPKAKVIHNFGRADQVDRQALARLVRSISRYLDPAEATAAAVPGEVNILDAGRWGPRTWPTGCGPGWVSARRWPGSPPAAGPTRVWSSG